MIKKILKVIAYSFLILAVLYGFGRLTVVLYDSYIHLGRMPYTVIQTKDSITIKWQTKDDEIGSIEFGKDLKNPIQVKETIPTDTHIITLSDLEECTKYFYKVHSKSLKIDNTERSFETLCDKRDFQRIWVLGDGGYKSDNQTNVYQAFLKYIDNNFSNLDSWLLLGDNAYRSGTQKQYNSEMFEPYSELIKRYTPWVLIGNHDNRRFAFDEIFDFPKDGQSGGVPSGVENYYAIEDGNLHLIMLDSERIDRDSDGAMAKWLEEDLKANKKPWVIVAFHTPPYSDGGHKSDNDKDSGGRLKEMRENFVPIFDKYGVDLVLSGHSHGYERSKLIYGHYGKSDTFSQKNIVQNFDSSYDKSKSNKGTVYMVCGSATNLDGADYSHPALPFSFMQRGSVILEITPSLLVSKFINAKGEIVDVFSINKGK